MNNLSRACSLFELRKLYFVFFISWFFSFVLLRWLYREFPLDERIKLVEELWDSIAADQGVLPLADDEKVELDRRLNSFEADGNAGRWAVETITEIRRKI